MGKAEPLQLSSVLGAGWDAAVCAISIRKRSHVGDPITAVRTPNTKK